MMGSSKYEHNPEQLDKDLERTQLNKTAFKYALSVLIDDCYNAHVDNFNFYETAINVLHETLREKFIEYQKKL